MRLITVVQARMTSTRLPGKTLATVGDRTLLEWVLHRLTQVEGDIGPVIVATSTHPSDKRIADLCDRLNVNCYRGSLTDVLDRFYTLACRCRADAIIRVTADSPLLSPRLLAQVRDRFLQGDLDYCGSHTDGIGQEIIGYQALEEAWRHAHGADREHVVTYTTDRPDDYRVEWVDDDNDLRFSVDTQDDLDRLRRLYESSRGTLFDLDTDLITAWSEAAYA